MAGTPKRIGPLALTTVMTTNIYQGGNGVAQVRDIIRHVHVVNKTAGAVTFSMWLGATGGNVAGTELYSAESIPANSARDFYVPFHMTSTDFLVGGASAATSLTVEMYTEQFVV